MTRRWGLLGSCWRRIPSGFRGSPLDARTVSVTPPWRTPRPASLQPPPKIGAAGFDRGIYPLDEYGHMPHYLPHAHTAQNRPDALPRDGLPQGGAPRDAA